MFFPDGFESLAGAERAARISSSLLGFAREADEELAAPLRRTIDDAVGCMGREPEKDGIDLTIDVPDVRVAMSPLNLQQVILNLLMNARKAMRHGRELRMTGRTEGRFIALSVADSGPGIPSEIRDRLFGRWGWQRTDLNITLRQTTGADEESARED